MFWLLQGALKAKQNPQNTALYTASVVAGDQHTTIARTHFTLETEQSIHNCKKQINF